MRTLLVVLTAIAVMLVPFGLAKGMYYLGRGDDYVAVLWFLLAGMNCFTVFQNIVRLRG